MCDTLSGEKEAAVREAFTLFDKDGDGSITKSEFGTALKSLGRKYTDCQLQEIFNRLDKDGTGTIGFNEFLMIMTNNHLVDDDNDNEMRKSFEMFDKDGNGYISASELRSVMAKLGQKLTNFELGQMIQEADIDGDGQIDYEEFVRMMSSR